MSKIKDLIEEEEQRKNEELDMTYQEEQKMKEEAIKSNE